VNSYLSLWLIGCLLLAAVLTSLSLAHRWWVNWSIDRELARMREDTEFMDLLHEAFGKGGGTEGTAEDDETPQSSPPVNHGTDLDETSH